MRAGPQPQLPGVQHPDNRPAPTHGVATQQSQDPGGIHGRAHRILPGEIGEDGNTAPVSFRHEVTVHLIALDPGQTEGPGVEHRKLQALSREHPGEAGFPRTVGQDHALGLDTHQVLQPPLAQAELSDTVTFGHRRKNGTVVGATDDFHPPTRTETAQPVDTLGVLGLQEVEHRTAHVHRRSDSLPLLEFTQER